MSLTTYFLYYLSGNEMKRHIFLRMVVLVVATQLHFGHSKRRLTNRRSRCLKLEFCHCSNSKEGFRVICTGDISNDQLYQDISTFPGKQFGELNFKNMNITVLPSHLFTNINVVQLRWHDSPLEGMEDGTFQQVVTIKILNLGNNNLREIPRALSGILMLTNLQMPNNKIRAIDHELSDLTNLTVLDLSGNLIEVLNETAFQNLRNLERLFLGNNHINFLSRSLFDRTKQLELIELQNNRISRVHVAFQGLLGLKVCSF